MSRIAGLVEFNSLIMLAKESNVDPKVIKFPIGKQSEKNGVKKMVAARLIINKTIPERFNET